MLVVEKKSGASWFNLRYFFSYISVPKYSFCGNMFLFMIVEGSMFSRVPKYSSLGRYVFSFMIIHESRTNL